MDNSGHGEWCVATAVTDRRRCGLAAAAAASLPTAAYSATIDDIPNRAQWKKLQSCGNLYGCPPHTCR